MIAHASLVALLLLESVSALALSPRFVPHEVLESRSAAPYGWLKKRDALVEKRSEFGGKDKRTLELPFKFHLAQRNLHKAERLLMDVSDPESVNYGRHWTPNDVMNMFAPAKESVDHVIQWLKDAGIASDRIKYNKHEGAVNVKGLSVADAEDLLQTKYHVYEHLATDRAHVACDSYKVPSVLRRHIDFVTPTLHFDAHVGRKRADAEGAVDHPVEEGFARKIGQQKTAGGGGDNQRGSGSAGGAVQPRIAGLIEKLFPDTNNCVNQTSPACLQLLYKYTPDFQKKYSKNSYGIVEYTPQSYIDTDIDVFARNFSKKLLGYRPIFAPIDGATLYDGPPNFAYNGESNLDLQFAAAVVRPVNVTVYQVGDMVEGASFNNFLNAIDGSYCTYDGGNDPDQDATYPDPYPGGYQGPEDCGKYKPTNVISTSYAYNEADLTYRYEQRQCNEYMKLGLLGVTVLYSSGDYGVAGNGGDCIDPSTGAYSPDAPRFNPSFPGTCPYITSVGATQTAGKNPFYYETACEQVIYSGGGFSNNFPIPDYQKAAVASYFKNNNPPYSAVQYNNSMNTRGFPDISANGANYPVAIGGQFYRVFGTSASSPVVGGLVTLLNDFRLSIGKKPLGFINPFLYKNTWALTDITSGNNPGCGTQGFSAVKGWDPVTGLGTPNVAKLLIAAAALK